jgi:hypothetical protein
MTHEITLTRPDSEEGVWLSLQDTDIRAEDDLRSIGGDKFGRVVAISLDDRTIDIKKPTVKQLGSSNPNRSVRLSCCTPRRSHKGKASSFPTRPRAVRPLCLRGLTRTETPSAAGAVARPPTSRLVQLPLNRRGRRGGLGNAKLVPMPLRRRAPSQIR